MPAYRVNGLSPGGGSRLSALLSPGPGEETTKVLTGCQWLTFISKYNIAEVSVRIDEKRGTFNIILTVEQ